jgi:hypothetical protein
MLSNANWISSKQIRITGSERDGKVAILNREVRVVFLK